MKTDQELQNKLNDIRTQSEHDRQFRNGIRQEGLAIKALEKLHRSFGYITEGQKIEKDERLLERLKVGQIKDKPDYWYHVQKLDEVPYTVYTYEIKCTNTNRFWRNTVCVKPYTINTMIVDPVQYPNGRLLVATSTRFAIMDALEVRKWEIKPTPIFGGKPSHFIPEDVFTWHSWLEPITGW